MNEHADSTILFDQVRLPQRPPQRSPESWEKNVELVKTLCGMAEGVKWTDVKVGNVETHMPKTYNIGGATVEFSPSWSFITIAGMIFNASLPHEALIEATQNAARLEQIQRKYPLTFAK